MIDPKRIVFENAKRTDIINMYNNGNDTLTYFIGFKHFEMQESGSLKDVDSEKTVAAFADSLFRFFPRIVKLKPRSSQALRIQFLKPKDLTSGEYRTHLYFVEAESKKPIDGSPSDTDKSISLSIHARIAMAIPVIARYQTQGAVVSLKNLSLSDPDTSSTLKAIFEMVREGDESCYGDLLLTYKAPDGKVTTLSEMKGTGVYSTLSKRVYKMSFKLPKSLKLENGGMLKLEYRHAGSSTKEPLLANIEVSITK